MTWLLAVLAALAFFGAFFGFVVFVAYLMDEHPRLFAAFVALILLAIWTVGFHGLLFGTVL